ncbi:MAG: hypothetical protein Q8P21_00275 [bacterium]|nr:hypothetical protein [bacterium]
MIHKEGVLQVAAEHVDQYGHVNYKAILSILEPFQDEVVASCGGFEGLEIIHGLKSFVKKLEVIWSGQLYAEKSYNVSTRLELGRTSLTFEHLIASGDTIVASLKMVVVMVDKNDKPTPIPMEIREKLNI